jgi:hypothetical protein
LCCINFTHDCGSGTAGRVYYKMICNFQTMNGGSNRKCISLVELEYGNEVHYSLLLILSFVLQ